MEIKLEVFYNIMPQPMSFQCVLHTYKSEAISELFLRLYSNFSSYGHTEI